MKKISLTMLMMLSCSVIFAQIWHWTQGASEVINAGCTDDQGNYYFTGYNLDWAYIDTETLGEGGYLVKLNCEGNTSMGIANNDGWSSVMSNNPGPYPPAPLNVEGIDVVCNEDTVYQVGTFKTYIWDENNMPITPAPHVQPYEADIFVASFYSGDGDKNWVRGYGGPGADHVYAVSADDNYVYIAGMTETTATFGSFPINLNNRKNPFVAIINKSNGSVANVFEIENYSSTGEGIIKDIIVDVNGNIYISGEQTADLVFTTSSGTITATHSGVKNGFFAKFNSSGICQWVKTMESTDAAHESHANAIALDGVGGLYIGGTFKSTVNFSDNNNSFSSDNGSYDVFLAKYNVSGSGTYQWFTNKGGKSPEYANDICFVPGVSGGYVYLTGYIGQYDVGIPGLSMNIFDFGDASEGLEESYWSNPSKDQLLLLRFRANGSEKSAILKNNIERGITVNPLIDGSGCYLTSPNNVHKITEKRADIMIRDAQADNGTEPYVGGGWWGHSPYFINSYTDPYSGYQHNKNPVINVQNHLEVEYENIGGKTFTPSDGRFEFYYHKSSIGDKWETGRLWNKVQNQGDMIGNWEYLGSEQIFGVNPGGVAQVSFDWQPTLEGEYCFLVRFVSEKDPMTFPEVESVGKNIPYNNNIVEKNMVILDKNYKIYLPILPDYEQFMKIQFASPYANFQEYGEVYVSLGEILLRKWLEGGSQFDGMERMEDNLFLITDFDRATFNGIYMAEGDENYQITFDFRIHEGMEIFAEDNVIFDVQQHISSDQETYTLSDGQSYQLITLNEEKSAKAHEGNNNMTADDHFMIYPNPSDGIINYSFNISEISDIDIKVYNLLGEIVDEYNNAHLSGTIDMSMLPEGTYMLRATDSKGQTYYQKLIKE